MIVGIQQRQRGGARSCEETGTHKSRSCPTYSQRPTTRIQFSWWTELGPHQSFCDVTTFRNCCGLLVTIIAGHVTNWEPTYSKVREQCLPYTMLIDSMRRATGMYSAPSSSAMPAQQSSPSKIPVDESPAGFAVDSSSCAWDDGMSRTDKVALASTMTKNNKKSRVKHMELASARQGLEIVEAQIKAVRSPEEIKNLMESSQVAA